MAFNENPVISNDETGLGLRMGLIGFLDHPATGSIENLFTQDGEYSLTAKSQWIFFVLHKLD